MDDAGTVACTVGTQGCPCGSGDVCAKNSAGEQLVCQGGLCEQMTCPIGSSGCACRRGTTCDAPSDTCTNGFCVASSCTAGSMNCACLAGTCSAGLFCLQDTVCVDGKGHEGGPCFDDGRCDLGNRCDPASGHCIHCDLGSEACQCTTAGACNSGLVCAAQLCVSAQQLPPQNPVCYTPCRADIINDAGTIRCTTDQVYAGCQDGQTCTNGSCLGAGETKPTCVGDVDCPFFQVCLRGGCYSNCTSNADCPTGEGCYRKACRPTCQVATGSAPCATGYACTADDGQNGFCTPMPRPNDTPSDPPQGGLKLPIQLLSLSNVHPQANFIVVPQSQITQEVTVRKLWHQITYSDGSTERVDAPRDLNGDYRTCDPAKNECPLWWLGLGAPGAATVKDATISYHLAPDCKDDVTVVLDAGANTICGKIAIDNAGGSTAVSWQGALEISSRDSRVVMNLSYVQRPDGQWTGDMHYFGTFETTGLQQWIDAPNKLVPSTVQNAFIQRWGAMRTPGALDNWGEFVAVLTATRTGSWNFDTVKQKCKTLNPAAPNPACYPYTNAAGMRPYVQDMSSAPVPSGVSELPFALNLKVNPNSPTIFEGRIESSKAMHYPGNPAIKLELAGDPTQMASCFNGGGTDCVVFLKNLDITGASGTNQITTGIGGRYFPTSTCTSGYVQNNIPWLLTDFVGSTTVLTTGQRVKKECRDQDLPFDRMTDATLTDVDQNLSMGNPVPDGAARKRTLRFLDGALVNQNELFLIFEEKFDGFVAGMPQASAYGYIQLKRAPANLNANSYSGTPASSVVHNPPQPTGAQCSPDLLSSITWNNNYDTLAQVLMNGTSVTPGYVAATPGTVHYLCEDLGVFDSIDPGVLQPISPIGNIPPPVALPDGGVPRMECPAGSKVTYFIANKTDAQVAGESCFHLLRTVNGKTIASCMDTLSSWEANGVVTEVDPTYKCTDPTQAYCDLNRMDLRVGKTFYQKGPSVMQTRAFQPLQPLIDAAFRYKTRFRSSTGGQVGFAPALCIPNSDQVPYCYDPAEIEEARDRLDCLINIYDGHIAALSTTLPSGNPTKTQLLNMLQQSYAVYTPSLGVQFDGFERLYAELLIMKGDDALTAAYASRFDLAAAGGASFPGSQLEKNGIDLTSVAGAEMFDLYKSIQYYQLALDRLYAHGPDMAQALTRGPVGSANNFITSATVTEYLERLVRAASQKARAWSEVAKRYQNFNRPDLARTVIARAYVNAYLESALLSSMMFAIDNLSSAASRPQIRSVIENMQLTFRMALVDMRQVFEAISDQINYFGLSPEYIPFPALDSAAASANAYDTLATITRQRIDVARTRETEALMAGVKGKTDAAQFQSDLVQLRNNYENQLASLCGSFTDSTGVVYPAIRKYAQLDPLAKLMGDPCGRMGNGELHNAMVQVSDTVTKLQESILHHDNLLKAISNETTRASAQCNLINAEADYQYQAGMTVASMQNKIHQQKALGALVAGMVGAVIEGIKVEDCEIQCASSAAEGVVTTALGIASAEAQYANELSLASAEQDIADFQAQTFIMLAPLDCQKVQADSTARVAELYNESLEANLEILRAQYAMKLALSDVQKHANDAQRLQLQQQQAESLAIDVAAAQNDPNVRIYQNDAVVNADVSFNDAIQMAYRQTRVFEYYTSQSYAKKGDLFLIRMVSAGQYNLENYILELDNAFLGFQEEFGNPDLRVMALSLRDDILKIPYIGPDQQPLNENDRIKQMQAALRDVGRLDSHGYLTLPFSTQLKELSPLTRDHKIHHIEVDLQGGRMGDHVAHVYVRMAGTGVVRNVTDGLDYFVFPERTAVVNASILGNKLFDPEVYKNYRFRDRPLVNTEWELVFNQRDELVNQDIDLQSLADVRVLIYYTDFTTF